ncbi:phosphoethanolamine transferase [Solemya velesiana gill symbiont]|uniref:Sulfatase N-terminal domain-containing protein n=1 Tax=Solemya velesiana gill symbiont TaxID=1918948 RepID=A0A1T2KVU6_9GAMM|nr:phosphoethanolamine transferase [Solemya velesiana gill symbiont]OOZ36932.1 hypothetical protein BOW51_04775 [Solemya velesiana gill symbiont]
MKVEPNNNYTLSVLSYLLHIAIGVVGISLLYSVKLGFENTAYYLCVYFLVFTSIELIRLLLPVAIFRVTFILPYMMFIILWTLVIALHSDNRDAYGPVTGDTVKAIYQSNWREMGEYLYLYTSISNEVYLATWLGGMLASFLWVALGSLKKSSIKGRVAFLVAASSMFFVGLTQLKSEVSLIYSEAKTYGETLERFQNSRQSIDSLPWVSSVSSDFQGNLIVVIGESTTRHHMGIYNYARDTTPALNDRADELAIFKDAIATHSHTTESLSDALALNSRTDRKEIHEIPDVINLLQSAGFHVTWLSNQNAVGIWDNTVSAMARETDYVKFHDAASGKTFKRTSYDMSMIHTLDRLLDGNKSVSKKVVFMHMMSTHFPYCTIIPSEFEDLTGETFSVPMDAAYLGSIFSRGGEQGLSLDQLTRRIALINCYDSAVKYVDSFLDTLLGRLEMSDEPTAVVYIADHGEAPLLGTGHESRMHSHFHVEIPFVVWSNLAFKRKHVDIWNRIKEAVDRPISLIDFSFGLLDIVDVNGVPGLSSRSFFSPGYEDFDRTTLHEKVHYDGFCSESDNIERTRANLLAFSKIDREKNRFKIWAHRVNSHGSLLEAKDAFGGVELDIVFDEKKERFFVYHPPADNHGLTLENYLKQDKEGLGYWLDWKNPSEKNMARAIKRLEGLNSEFQFKGRALVETQQGFQDTGKLTKNNWKSSFYLPTKKLLVLLSDGNEAQIDSVADEVVKLIEKHAYNAISFDVRLYPFYEKWLKDYVQNNEMDVYVWDQSLRIDAEDAIDRISVYMDDDTIDIFLVNFPSPFDL